nr:hypothetical protein P9270_027995 [Mesorhizobium sp. WSM4875]
MIFGFFGFLASRLPDLCFFAITISFFTAVPSQSEVRDADETVRHREQSNRRTSQIWTEKILPWSARHAGGESGLCSRQEERRLKKTYGNIFIHDEG